MINFNGVWKNNMIIQDVDMSEYDEADRNFNEKLLGMYKYMVHIKPFVIYGIKNTDDKKRMVDIITVYANLCMIFGEFKAMTVTHMPNLEYKRKFFRESCAKFENFLGVYKELIKDDDLVLTDAEKKLTL